ncbi:MULTISPECIES: hypothetical protein [Pseudonocardia]|uniref:Uncharacterized protein n=2 Tax=Pseudonocardia TaxID=1847 RepID=A0A1Y2N1Z4_PSEAH|nr:MULTISPECIES: hypothetical protein [Pseudonocardia]OSY40918.1 hypothetical protein BG845_02257 [Pseudonocardia autotrophica]TDN73952.1 hypothetical protein C8E95_3064 [Pseudonocardia autotrophica]BBG04706.1 hypothetical protein Pdca_59150 [Pseudonocardia autotrophica]GEC28753.1 hypothetical protein PSA01_57820 [Pseudonocardia saturnea]
MTDTISHTVPATAGRIAGTAAVLGPFLLLGSSLLFLFVENGVNSGVLGGTVGLWACLALAIAVPGVLRAVEPVAPRAAPRVAAVVTIGLVAGAAFNIQAMYHAATGTVLLDRAGEDVPLLAVLAFLPWGWFTPLGLALSGWLLLRAGARMPGALLAVAGVLFVIGRPGTIGPVVLASDLALIAALVPLGATMATGRSPVRRS